MIDATRRDVNCIGFWIGIEDIHIIEYSDQPSTLHHHHEIPYRRLRCSCNSKCFVLFSQRNCRKENVNLDPYGGDGLVPG